MSDRLPPEETWGRKFCICISLRKALTCEEKYLNIARCIFYKDCYLSLVFDEQINQY